MQAYSRLATQYQEISYHSGALQAIDKLQGLQPRVLCPHHMPQSKELEVQKSLLRRHLDASSRATSPMPNYFKLLGL